MRWSIFISIITFVLASVFSVVSTAMLQGVVWAAGALIVLFIVCIGILFDMMGIASASANERPFHAMAAEKVPGAKQSIFIVRNADRFSNFCNDVVGDICGIISGTASALVVVKMIGSAPEGEGWLTAAATVVFSAVVSALTVGGKAVGKSFAIHYSIPIVLWIGRLFYLLENRLGVRVLGGGRKKINGKRGNKRAARSDTSA
ncbi:CNNM domain-containing protein [Paenibacillus sp.]|uniref:CNNM domain-containing protein n=1 Tax=Paenibacillus sp. TaxID=58172 RepID=UPI002D4C7707|nr:CNNM domain-containing protein [Paenibacillus sp.]HZG55381.1 CNNM domain-containing protein [Paenibacillus sp.]